MDKKEVAAYFDERAQSWDAELRRNDAVIGMILDNAGVSAGKSVLDVACGTGVLIPDYLDRAVASVLAVDISEEMTKICADKFADREEVTVLCCDAEELKTDRKFDCIMIYNAFPHFPDPEKTLRNLSGLLAPGGTLTVAHGFGRKVIDSCHQGSAHHVSRGVMPVEELTALFEKTLKVTVQISDDRMYQVTGKKE